MTHADTARARHLAANGLPAKDKAIIVILLLFTSVAYTLELYWIIHNQVMENQTDLLARALSLYWPADRSWRIPGYPIEKALNLSLESVNTFVTPLLSMALIWAICKHRPWRYPLQLLISACTAYGTYLYYSVWHISGYAIFDNRDTSTYLIFYFANLPWLAIYAWMAWDAFRAIVRGQPA